MTDCWRVQTVWRRYDELHNTVRVSSDPGPIVTAPTADAAVAKALFVMEGQPGFVGIGEVTWLHKRVFHSARKCSDPECPREH